MSDSGKPLADAPLVSVAMATYNGEKFLEEQLDTVFAQDHPNLEVIVCDDCSTDGTQDILRRYAASKRLRFSLNESRLGVKENFARAASLCQGDYIAFCDQDDVWLPDRIKTLLEHQEGAMLVYAPALEFLDENGQTRPVPEVDQYLRFCRKASRDETMIRLATSNWIAGHQMLFRRELLRLALPIPPSQPHHDAWFAVMAAVAGTVALAPDGRMYYRRHAASVTYSGHQSHRGDLKAKLRAMDVDEGAVTKEIARLTSIRDVPELSALNRRKISTLIVCHRSRFLSGFHLLSMLKAVYFVKRFYGLRSISSQLIILAQILLGTHFRRIVHLALR